MPGGKSVRTPAQIETKILESFSSVAETLGFSSLHGSIIGALLVADRPLSLRELSQKTGYSTSMISISLDFLEVMGMVRRVKKTADRNLYIELQGDLLESLKNIVLLKIQKAVADSLQSFEESKEELKKIDGEEKKRLMYTISTLEHQVKRVEKYVSLLSHAT